jgi:hypothetical protein
MDWPGGQPVGQGEQERHAAALNRQSLAKALDAALSSAFDDLNVEEARLGGPPRVVHALSRAGARDRLVCRLALRVCVGLRRLRDSRPPWQLSLTPERTVTTS